MAEKRMLIVDSDLLEKIDSNRGEMSRAEMLHFLIDSMLTNEPASPNGQYLKREEFLKFTQEMKELLRRFLDFFMSYGVPVGDNSKNLSFDELTQKLQALANTANKARTGK